MTRRTVIVAVVLALFAGVVAHAYTVRAYPGFKMKQAMQRISRGGKRVNAFVHADVVTPKSRGVVRPSPDLIYSVCIYDLSKGDVVIRMSPQDTYHSLSLYDDQTNNFYVKNGIEAGNRVLQIRLTRDAGEKRGPAVVVSPSVKGLALIRRSAATPGQVAAAKQIREQDVCRVEP